MTTHSPIAVGHMTDNRPGPRAARTASVTQEISHRHRVANP